MPMSEMVEWQNHFLRHPPDDPARIELLLATLVSVVVNAMGRKGGRQVSPYDVAPWLSTPEIEESRRKETERREREAVLELAKGG